MRLGTWMAALACMSLCAGEAFASSITYQGYTFKADVVNGNGKHYREFNENRRPTLKVKANEEYAIVVYNPLPVRVAVAVSIDGLNTVDGQRTTPRNAKKWMINPKSSITVSGWQTSKSTQRKFVFTEDSESFAQWREDKDKKEFTRNLGVIGVAWFWNSRELDEALHPPQPFADEAPSAELSASSAGKPSSAPAAAKSARRAGTGMGEERQHRVTQVEFHADAGMFSLQNVLKIYYEFAPEPPEPQPFVEEEEEGRFAPDMHKK